MSIMYYQIEDAEDSKKMEQIINSEKQREKMEALGQLAGGIAHDFNNQLMSIIGNATMIQRTDDINKIREYADRIIHISQSTASITKKILMFAKKESKNNVPIDLKGTLDNAFNMIESILDKKIELSYSYNAMNKKIIGDEAQLENLIINLIINSRDAMEDKREGGKIKIGTEDTVVFYNMDLSHGEVIEPGQYIKIYIEDNGSGMKEENLNKIFEPYFTTKNKSKGTGLGLSVVFGTIKSHSGYVNVKSQLNEGTIFEIFLPVLRIKDISVQREIEGELILLVDDDVNALEVEAELLEDLGYEVVKLADPSEALKFYKDYYKKISFVVLDIMMPDMNGKILLEELQKINKDVTAIFISGFVGQLEYEELIKNGYIVIEKPFTFADLSYQIAKIYM